MRSSALVVRRSSAAPILAAPSLVLLAAPATLRSVFHALEQARRRCVAGADGMPLSCLRSMTVTSAKTLASMASSGALTA
ncbi:hypothetical protein PF005_g31010 [Phytophthora fragariae]|uniref:Uncharacterized protein n=1 Tax=Phytophthora fragariae TaxID=53985 RepID=A0A6A3V6R1_9STRA|nr:hypothetical protein PF005_g31010 [Phytophthora fragariae]